MAAMLCSRLLTTAAAGALLAVAAPAAASAAGLDPTFAHGPLSVGAAWSQANDLVLQPGGSVVLAGRANTAAGEPRVALARVSAAGLPDASFGDGGQRLVAVGDGGQAWAIARQADGRLVAVGGTGGEASSAPRWSLVRTTADGDLDTTFGDDGVVDVGIGPFAGATGMSSDALDVAVQADGRILVAGTAWFAGAGPSNEQHAVVARFEADGNLDPTFGGGDGWVDFVAGDLGSTPFGLVPRAAGGFLLGVTGRVRGVHREVVAGFTATGALDPTWGEAGTTPVDLSADGNSVGYAMAAAPGGATIVAGEADAPAAWAMSAVRLGPSGAVDRSFGDEGRSLVAFPDMASRVDEVLVDPVSGALTLAGSAGEQPALARLRADGTLDGSFGTDGRVREVLGAFGFAYAAALTGDGRVVVGGQLEEQMFAARYGEAPGEPGPVTGGGPGAGATGGSAPAPVPAPPASEVPAVPASAPSAGPVAGPLPPSAAGTSCAGRRAPVTYTLRNAGIVRGGGVSVWQGAQRVPIVVRVRNGTVTVDPRSLPSGRYRVRLTGVSRTGHRRTIERTLRTCR
jgi:uncharacterized delta-60 repeat protein